jgi:hypothetical protein
MVQDMLHMEVNSVFLLICFLTYLYPGGVHPSSGPLLYRVLYHVDCVEHVQSTSKYFGPSSENTK